MAERLRVIQGADKQIVIRLKISSGDPFDLSDATGLQVIFESKDRGKITLTNNVIPATKALGKLSTVTFNAQTAGKNGNGIVLNFNGIDSVQTVVDAWNTANPLNQVGFTGLGTVVLPSGSVRLTGGYDQYRPIEVFGSPLLGKMLITLLEKDTLMMRNGQNQSVKIVVDEGEDTGGRRIMGYFENKLDVIGV